MLGFFRRIVGKELSPEEQAKKRSEAIAAGAGNGALTTCVHFLVWDGDGEDAAHASVERLLKSASAAGLVRSSSGGGAGHDGVVVDDFDVVNRRVPSIVRLGQSDANAPTFAPDGSCYNVTGGTSSHRSEHHGTGDDQFLSASTVAAFADVYARVNCLPSGDGVADGASTTRGTGGAWRVPNEGTHPWLTSYSSAGTAPPVQFISAISAEGIAIECASRLSDEFMAHAPILVVPEVGSTEEDYVLRRVAAYRREFGAENGDHDERVYSDAEGESPSRAHQPKRFLGEDGVEEEIVDAQEEGPHVDAQRRAAAAARRGKGLESIDRVSFREQLLASEYMQCACDMDPVRRTIFRAAANDWDDELVTTAEFSVAFQKSISVQHAALCDMKAQEGNLAERALAKKRAARQGGDLDSNVAPGRFDDALSARTVGPNATLSADAKKKALLDAKKFGEIASQISCGVSVLSHMIVVVPAAQFRRIYEQVLDPRFSEEAHYVLAEAEQRMHFCPGSVTQLHLAPSVAHTVQAQLIHEARRHAAATGAGADDAAAGNGPQSARPISAWGADSSSLAGGALPPPSARTTNEANFIASTPSVEVTFDPQGAASAARTFAGENSGSSAVGGAMTTDYTTVGSTTLSSSAAGASHTAGSAYNTSQGAGAAGARSSAVGVGNGGYGQGENFERTRAAVGVAGGWTLQARWSGAAATPLLSDLAAATSGGGGGAAIFAAMLPHLNVAARVGVALHPHPATFYEAIRPTWVRQLAAAAQARAGGAIGMAVDMGGSAAAAAAGPASPLSSLGLLTSPGETAPLVGARNPFASPQLTAHALVAAGGEMMPPMTARNPVQALSQYVDQAIAPPAFAPGIDKKQQAIQLEAHRDRLRAHLERLLDVLSTAGEAPFFLSCTRRDEICRLRTPATIETLLLILYNLDQRPTEQRFRILACGSERFYETLGKYPAAMAVLGGVGFSRFNATARVLVLSEAEAAAWAVERRRCIAVLEALYEARRIQHYLNPPPPPRNVDDLMY